MDYDPGDEDARQREALSDRLTGKPASGAPGPSELRLQQQKLKRRRRDFSMDRFREGTRGSEHGAVHPSYWSLRRCFTTSDKRRMRRHL